MTWIDGGGWGKCAGGVVLAGEAPGIGGEQLYLHGHGTKSGEVLAVIMCTKQRERRHG